MNVTITCKSCKQPFVVPYKKRNRTFCSRKCYTEYRHKGTVPISATSKCDTCEKEVAYYTSQRTGEHIYCSRECADKGRRNRIKIECRWCGNLFEIKASEYQQGRRLCSWKCRLAEKDDAKNRICEVCEKPFRVKNPSLPTRTCSPECRYTLRRRGKHKVCEVCKIKFWVRPSTMSKRRFCSRNCQSQWQSENIRENNHPNWQGGLSFLPYGPEWTPERREEIQKRDGYKCMECGTDENLSVHHVDYDKMNCDHFNLITLCLVCNSRANHNRTYWKQHYSKILEDAYLS